jgi:glycosyltransferase involved in cell wall biosynthesis
MNIVLVSQNYRPMVGGIETQARMLAQEFAARGENVAVAAVNFRVASGSTRLRVLHDSLLVPSFQSYEDNGVRIHALTPTPAERVRMLPVAVRAVPRLQRYAYQPLYEMGYRWYRPIFVPKLRRLMAGADVVHGLCGGYLGWAAQEAAASLSIPYVCTPFVHPGQWGDDRRNIAYYRQADAVIGLVPTDADYLRSIGAPRETVHVVGVSPDLPASANAEAFRAKHRLGDAPLVLYVGRLMKAKGAPALLAAAPHVWRALPDARFVFAGPGTDEERSIFRDVDSRALYLGMISQQDKADALAACNLFCMPSVSEILPTVYLEAWSMGKAVVGGLAHGVPELIAGAGGGIASGQEPAQLADAILSLLRDPQRCQAVGAAGRSLVEQKYSPRAICDTLMNLYRAVQCQEHTCVS